MRQLIYLSHWTPAARRDLDLALQEIVAASIQNNRICDVTGFLIAQNGIFLQLLEGPQRSVTETFRRIGSDARHSDVRVLSDIQSDRRLFRQWNMAACTDAGLTDAAASMTGDEARALLLSAAGETERRERRFYG